MSKWKTKDILLREKLLDEHINELMEILRDAYKKSSERIINEILVLYNKIMDGENILVSDLYKFNRYYKLLNSVNEELARLGLYEEQEFNNKLTSLYIKNSKIVGESINFWTEIDDLTVEKALKHIWVSDGLTFSDRIWADKKQLVDEVMSGLIDCVATGSDPEILTHNLMERFDVSYSRASRLVRTELKHIEIQSTIDRYKAAGIEQYEYMTAEDDKVCDEAEYCKCLDGKIFPINDTEHLPPQHPNCRCSIRAVVG